MTHLVLGVIGHVDHGKTALVRALTGTDTDRLPEEQALGWYNYLEENLRFPFLTRCIRERAISPLRVDDEVEVIGLGPQEECAHEMFVLTRWGRRGLAIPLSQLEVTVADEQTTEPWRTGITGSGRVTSCEPPAGHNTSAARL